MYPHEIRLHGPWESGGRRLTVPIRLGPGPVVLERRFGAPRQLDDWEKVWLIPDDLLMAPGKWQLNGSALLWNAPTSRWPRRTDITGLIRERNRLTVTCENNAPEGMQFQGARLEIRPHAEISALIVEARGTKRLLHVDVECGPALDPLELYLMIDSQSAGYAGPFTGRPTYHHSFELPEDIVGKRIQFDLVSRSQYWDSLEQILPGMIDCGRPGVA